MRDSNWDKNQNNPRGLYMNRWLSVNDIKYRIKFVGPVEPIYPEAGSYLDICMCDDRIELVNLIREKLEVFPFGSDHNGIKVKIKLNGLDELKLLSAEQPHAFNFKKTRWTEFQYSLSQLENKLPNNRNLSNGEIDCGIDELDQAIRDAIKENTPEFKKNIYIE